MVVAYVTSNKSVNKTAEALFMHRNTVYQRITKIQDYFGIDFSDHNLVTQIHISALAMQCAEKLDPCTLRCWSEAEQHTNSGRRTRHVPTAE